MNTYAVGRGSSWPCSTKAICIASDGPIQIGSARVPSRSRKIATRRRMTDAGSWASRRTSLTVSSTKRSFSAGMAWSSRWNSGWRRRVRRPACSLALTALGAIPRRAAISLTGRSAK